MALSRWKHLKNRRAGAALLAALALAAWWRLRGASRDPATEDKTAEVVRGDLTLSFKEVGDVAAKSTVNVASKVSGRVLSLFVQEGSRVSVGQKLAVIQPGKTETEHYLPSSVFAPIPGVVMRYVNKDEIKPQNARFTEVGDYVTGIFESQTPNYLMTIADMRQLLINLKISEMDILKLSENMPVTVSIDALRGSTFPAVVSMISPQAEKEQSGGKVFRVDVAFLKADPRLRTGMTARVDATLQKAAGVLKVPLTGIFEEGGQTVAYRVEGSGKPRQVRVELGLRAPLEAEVLKGLRPGDRVLTEKPTDFIPLASLKKAPGGAPAQAAAGR